MWLTDLISSNDEIVLKSGESSNFYIDFRKLYNDPRRLKQLSLEMGSLIRAIYDRLDPEIALCGLPYAAIPLATLISVVAGQPLLLLRKERKEHGTAKMVEGEAKKCFLIDDVFTTGSSLLSAKEKLEKEGVEVLGAFVVFARGEAKLPFPVHALYDLTDLDGEARLR